MDKFINLIVKILLLIGSLLFLIGAITYLMKYDTVGLYVYLFCSIFFFGGSLIDLVYYMNYIKNNNVNVKINS